MINLEPICLPFTAGEDYNPVFKTLTFVNGSTLQCLSFSILDDSILEGVEVFLVRLLGSVSIIDIISPGEASIFITDNDSKFPQSTSSNNLTLIAIYFLPKGIDIMGFEQEFYIVNETMGHQEMCVELGVEIQRGIELFVFTMESGSAQGIKFMLYIIAPLLLQHCPLIKSYNPYCSGE